MMKGWRIVCRDECGSEFHVGEPVATWAEAESMLATARNSYGEECKLWVESFDHAAPYYDVSSGRMVYPERDDYDDDEQDDDDKWDFDDYP